MTTRSEEPLAIPEADEEEPATRDAEMKEIAEKNKIEHELAKLGDNVMSTIEELIRKVNKEDKAKEEAEEEATKQKKYPEDCFSLIEHNGSMRGSRAFLFGLFVILFQVAIYLVYLYNVVGSARAPEYIRDYYGGQDPRIDDSPPRWHTAFEDYDSDPNAWAHTHYNVHYKAGATSKEDINENWKHGIADYPETISSRPFWFRATITAGNEVAQAMAMLAYVLFPEGGMQDFIKTIQALSGGFRCASLFVLFFRLFHSLLAIFTVAVLIMESSQPIDVFLNFAAMNFVSQLDESAFNYAKEGMFGEDLKNATTSIAEGKPEKKYLRNNSNAAFKRTAHYIAMAIVFTLFLVTFIGHHGCKDDPDPDSFEELLCENQFDILDPLKAWHNKTMTTKDLK